MKKIILTVFIILPFAFSIPKAFGGTEVNIKSATVDSSTLTLKGNNFDANGGALIVIINGNILNGCNVTSSEVNCDVSGQTLEPGTTYTISVSAGNAPALNAKIDAFMLDGLPEACPTGASTSCYSGSPNTLHPPCQSGTSTCVGGVWGDCIGEVLPETTTEICGDDIDNDCDGLTDCDDTVDCPSTEDPCIPPPTCTDDDGDGICAENGDCNDGDKYIGICGDGTFCNGVEVCVSGACISTGNPCSDHVICDEANNACTSCASGWGDCDGNPNNGCETSLDTLTNCGNCGIACSPPSSSCVNGVCQ